MNKVVASLQSVLGDDLVAVYRYPKYPNETLVFVVQENAFQAVQNSKEILDTIPFICLSRDEVLNGADVFSLQFFAIQHTSSLLFGEDIFSQISISKTDLRRKIEYDIRNKSIYLRQEAIRKDPARLIPHIVPELIPVLLGVSFLEGSVIQEKSKLLQSRSFPNMDIQPLLSIDEKKQYSNAESIDILQSINTMLKQWAEYIDTL